MEKENNEKSLKNNSMKKKTSDDGSSALFIQRLVAFLLDVTIISFIASLVAIPFVDVEKSDKISNKSVEITQKYSNKEIDTRTYALEYMNLSYKLARNNGILSLITIIFEVLYFIVFQIYNKGQTLGKKLMKIQVISLDGDLSMNQMIFRSLVANSILVEIVSFAFMTFGSRDIYFYGAGIFGMIQSIIIFISMIMVMYGKSGCAVHDKLVHTKVVKKI